MWLYDANEGEGIVNIEFKPYMHIERLGTDEVEGILNGHVVVTTKIGGSNLKW